MTYTGFENDPMGTVRIDRQHKTILIRCLDSDGIPGWRGIYFAPDPDPKSTYFYYDLGYWSSEDFELMEECKVGVPNPAGVKPARRPVPLGEY